MGEATDTISDFSFINIQLLEILYLKKIPPSECGLIHLSCMNSLGKAIQIIQYYSKFKEAVLQKFWMNKATALQGGRV